MDNIILSPNMDEQKKGTAVIPIEEYNRLRFIEKQYEELCANKDAIVLDDRWGNYRRILSPTEAVKIAASDSKYALRKLDLLKEVRLPFLNLKGKKVKDLM